MYIASAIFVPTKPWLFRALSFLAFRKISQPTLQPTPWMKYCFSTSGQFFGR